MATVQKMFRNRVNTNAIVFSNAGNPLVNGDQSVALELPAAVIFYLAQFVGTPGVAGSIQIEKSNDGTNWVILAAADVVSGTHPVTATGAQIEFKTAARYIRLNVTAGDGTTSWTVTITCVSQRS